MGLCLQTPSGGTQQRELHQLQGCGKTHNQWGQSPPSPEGLAHPRAGRWDSYIPFMKAQHQGGADTMVSLVLGVAITPAHCVPAACTHPPVSDTLHLP